MWKTLRYVWQLKVMTLFIEAWKQGKIYFQEILMRRGLLTTWKRDLSVAIHYRFYNVFFIFFYFFNLNPNIILKLSKNLWQRWVFDTIIIRKLVLNFPVAFVFPVTCPCSFFSLNFFGLKLIFNGSKSNFYGVVYLATVSKSPCSRCSSKQALQWFVSLTVFEDDSFLRFLFKIHWTGLFYEYNFQLFVCF